MAKVIIQGQKEEIKKAEIALKNTFKVCSNIANVADTNEYISILDVYAEAYGKDRFSDEEIAKAMACCSNAEKNCPECPYRKEENCTQKVLMDGALYVRRLWQNAGRNSDAE